MEVRADQAPPSDAPRGVWPCPKRLLYRQALERRAAGEAVAEHAVFDPDLRGFNPAWPGRDHATPEAFAYVAFHADNPNNPSFDTRRIRCSGPYRFLDDERTLLAAGRPREKDPVVVFAGLAESRPDDPIPWRGWLRPASVLRDTSGQDPARDLNPGLLLSGLR